MNSAAMFWVSLTAVATGSAMLLLVYLGTRWLRRRRPAAHLLQPGSLAEVQNLVASDDSLVVGRQGGQIVFANENARKLFGLDGNRPDLNYMARMADPPAAFYELFAAEGQTRLTIAQRSFEATSVRLQTHGVPEYVVVMREIGPLTELTAGDERTATSLAALSEISKTITASLDLETALNTILTTIERIVDYQLAEVCLWDEEQRLLRARGRAGDRAYVVALNRLGDTYSADEGFAGWVATHRRPLLIEDVVAQSDVQPSAARARFPVRSVIGVPLWHANDLVGTLELNAFEARAYEVRDLALLETIAGQAAIAIRNAQLYAEQQAQVEELSGVMQVAQTASFVSDPQELFAGINDRVAKLMGVELCGILLYRDDARALVAQVPFRGIPDAVVETYRIPVAPGSPAVQLWRESPHWYSNAMADDPLIAALGLDQLIALIGIRTTLLAPLVVGGRRIGMIQIANKVSGQPFGESDARQLALFAGQAAALIDNARLVREAERRAERAEGLRQIAAITGSSQPLDEIVRQAVHQAVRLVGAELGLVLLLDEARAELAPQAYSAYGVAPEEALLIRLDAADPNFKYTVTASLRTFYTWRASRDRRVIDLYRPVQQQYEVESAVLVPLIVQGRGIGELWIAARRERGLQRGDIPLLSTVAAQLAAAIERNRLAADTDESLRHRVEQLSALTRIGRELNQTLELHHILQSVYDEAVRATGASCGSIVLLDLNEPEPQIRMRLGEEDPHRALFELERNVVLSGASQLIDDFAAVTDDPPHARVSSAVVVPIVYQGLTVGLIHLHSAQPRGFNAEMLEFSQALASQAAIAVGNAQRYELQIQRSELLRRRADQLSQLLQISRTVRSDRPLEENLEAITLGIQESVGYNVVLIGVLEQPTDLLHYVSAAGPPLATIEQLKRQPDSWQRFSNVLQADYRLSQSYFVPHDHVPEALAAAVQAVSHPRPPERGAAPGQWCRGDLLIVPLLGSGGQTLGMVRLDDPHSGQRPDRATVEILEIFANQAALAIENFRLFKSAEQRAAELAGSLETLQESYRELDTVSRSLSRKDEEMSQLVERLDTRSQRLLALHRVIAATSDVREPAALTQAVADNLVQEMELDVSLIARRSGANGSNRALKIVGASGIDNPDLDLTAMLSTHNPLRHVLDQRAPVLATDLGDHGWAEAPLIKALEFRSFICTPIFVEAEIDGALLAASRQRKSPFTTEDIDLFTIVANQVGISIENAMLHATTQQRLREQILLHESGIAVSARLDPAHVYQTLAQKGLEALAVDACMIFEWDAAADTISARSEHRIDSWVDPAGNSKTYALADYPLTQRVLHERVPRVLCADDQDAGAAEIALLRWAGSESILAVPMVIGNQAVGLVAYFTGPISRPYSEAEIRLIQTLAGQAAIALENARLLAETQELHVFTEAVLQSIEQGIVVLNAHGEILSCNDFIRRRFGWDDQALGQHLFDFQPILRDLGLASHLQQVLETGEPLRQFPIRYPLPYERSVLVQVSGYALRQAGEVSGVVLLLEDVSERAQLEADVRRRATQLQALTEVSRVISSVLRVEDVVSLVLEQVGRVIPFDTATLWLLEGDRLRVAAATGFEDDEERLGLVVEVADSQLYTEMTETQRPSVVPDVRDDPRFPGGAMRPTQSWLGIPLISKGQMLGALALDKVEANFYTTGHVELANAFANQAAVALENARLFEESVQRAIQLNERSQRLALLNRVSQELRASLALDQVLQVTVREMARALGVEQASVVIVDEAAAVGRLVAEYPPSRDPTPEISIPISATRAFERVRETLVPLAIENIESDPSIEPVRAVLQARGTKSILIVPLIVDGKLFGTVGLEELNSPRRFTAGEIELAQTIANQAAVAVQNAQLLGETQQQLAELSTLGQISRAITGTIDLAQLLSTLREQISVVIDPRNLYLALYDPANDEVTFPLFYRDGRAVEVSRQQVAGLTEHIIRTRKPLLVADADFALPANVKADATGQLHSFLGVPLLLGDKVIGVIAVRDFKRKQAFTEAHRGVLSTIAGQLAVAIENARLFGEVQQLAEVLEQRVNERTADLQAERDRVETLLRITSELSASLDLDTVLTRALSLVNDTIGASQGSLYLVDPQSDHMIHRAALGASRPLPPGGVRSPFRRSESLVGWVIKHREAAIVDNLDQDDRWLNRPFSDEHKSAIAVPLNAGEDVLGALTFYSDQPGKFSQEQLQLVMAAANQLASAINNAELYRLIRDQAERLGGMLRTQAVETSKSRAILESVADGVIVADQDGIVTVCNLAAERILHLDRSEVYGQPASKFVGWYGAAGQRWIDTINSWSVEPETYQPGEFLAQRLELDDKRVISVHLAPVISNDEFWGSVSLFRDITRDVEVDRLKTEFVTTVSHELRTPMTSIKGYADLLLMGAGGSLSDEQRSFMDTISTNADRLKALVEDLLDISKIESGEVKLNLKPVEIGVIIDEVVGYLHGRINERRRELEVVVDLPPELPQVLGDKDQLIQIITNLVDNAYTYSPDGGVITLRAEVISDVLQFDVTDTGIGLVGDEKVRIFERFYRGDDPLVLASAGTGLGLSIVQRLVDMHNGRIWAESEGRGKGSTISVLLPIAREEPAPAAA